jgi:hypothetical protein
VRAGIALAALFVVIQLIPYGRSHTNPTTTKEPSWDSPQTRALFMASCGDCLKPDIVAVVHEGRTRLVAHSTRRGRGRSAFDVSNWDQPQDVSAQEMAESIQGGSMPPWFYTPLHSRASLSKAQQQRLIHGLARTFAASPPLGGG